MQLSAIDLNMFSPNQRVFTNDFTLVLKHAPCRKGCPPWLFFRCLALVAASAVLAKAVWKVATTASCSVEVSRRPVRAVPRSRVRGTTVDTPVDGQLFSQSVHGMCRHRCLLRMISPSHGGRSDDLEVSSCLAEDLCC